MIDHYDANGVHRRRFGFDTPSRAVSEADMALARERSLRGIGDPSMRAAIEARMRGGSARHPAITRLVSLDDGSLWVRESPTEAADSVPWVIYAGPGTPRGRLMLAVDDHVVARATRTCCSCGRKETM